MRYPYYSPNLGIRDLIKALFSSKRNAEKKLAAYYKELTGKKYVLLTNSCRSALYLAYKAIGEQGEVITSPLTCKVAIDPIIETGNHPVYADISKSNLNIDPNKIEDLISDSTIAIQPIHLGGVVCDMNRIMNIAKRRQLYVIEDCAQSLGGCFENKPSGSFGDIVCFSLIKNAYGIGGGVFLTDSENIYTKAKSISQTFPKNTLILIYYRILRSLIETKRTSLFFELLYKRLLSFRAGKKSYKNVYSQLKQINSIEIKIAAYQINRYEKLHSQRKLIGRLFFETLNNKGLLINNDYNKNQSSFTKFFIFNPKIRSAEHIPKLIQMEVESMHLEHSAGIAYQDMLVKENESLRMALQNYFLVHDSIISLPLNERMNGEDVEQIAQYLKSVINEN
ncbi:MAG: DegT/DnrJ/EryC1/StrS family aminotransferase [Tenuifilaceae bacterium]|nr:DegT/DnrJ/EryC1/StrS family aminotransferase [Tenuifilaceae bacterium]